MRSEQPITSRASAYVHVIWLTATVMLCAWVAVRLGITDLTRSVSVDGQQRTVANGFALVDHPFHASRAASLLESLKHGHILRWMGQHQGGYPVEFYPLGVAWIDVLIYVLLFGTVPMVAVHKITVILLFLLPALSFWILARGDRLNPAAAFLASAIHFAVPGTWLNGGFTELVSWGLVTNVAGGSFALLTSACLSRYVLNHERRYGLYAIAAAAAAAAGNPRSLFAIVVVATSLLLVGPISSPGATDWLRLRSTIQRLALVGGLSVLIAAPVVFALFRYNGLYYFLHYETYKNRDDYWLALQNATSGMVAKAAMIGVLWALLSLIPRFAIRLSVSRALAVAAILYSFLTMWVATSKNVPPLVEQLEAPRLMPFQRQLMIWLASMAAISVISRVCHGLKGRQEVVVAVAAAAVAIWGSWNIVSDYVWHPAGRLPEQVGLPIANESQDANGAFLVETTAAPEFDQLQRAVSAATAKNADGSAILVIGNRQSWWHEQLWAPTWSQARFYYDDWMWYWHGLQTGPYDPQTGYFIPDPSEMLNNTYFRDHGIGAVLVTDMWVPNNRPSPKQTARTNSALAFVESFGEWDLYRVKESAPIISDGSVGPEHVMIQNESIDATFTNGDGHIVIRQNWFPRWKATVNGESVKVERRSDGYMQVEAPGGHVDLRLTYETTLLDWAGRASSVLGVIGALVFASAPILRRRRQIQMRPA